MRKGFASSSLILNFMRLCALGGQSILCRYPFRSTWRPSPSLFRRAKVAVPAPFLSFCIRMYMHHSLSPSLPLSFRKIKRHVKATWTRPSDKHVAGDISRHLGAPSSQPSTHATAIHSPPSPPPRRPLTLLTLPTPGLSFSRSREPRSRSRQRRNASLRLAEVSKGWEGGTIIYLLSLARPRTRVNHPRLRGYCFRRVRGAKIRTRVSSHPTIGNETERNCNLGSIRDVLTSFPVHEKNACDF